MCQLLGMNCNVPTDICFSFKGFKERGGATDEHRDGWGIAFFEGKGCRCFIDPRPSAESPISRLIEEYPIRSRNVIAHIRRATLGEICLENTHPFRRELRGRYWVFAHNGDLKEFHPQLKGNYQPVGSTDSERAFCLIMEHLEQERGRSTREILRELSQEIAGHGTFNFLLSNGSYLFAYRTTQLFYLIRQQPFPSARLKDRDLELDFRSVTRPGDRVAIIATEPLTSNELWTPLPLGELSIFREGGPLPDSEAGGLLH